MNTAVNIKSLYSDYIKTLETYIMVKIKQETVRLTPQLEAKGRAPIYLSIGAPVQAPPEFVVNAIKKALDEPGIHSYSSPKGEGYYLEAVASRMKKRFGVELNPKDEIISLIGSKEGLSNMFRLLITPAKDDKDKDIILTPDPGYASYKEQIKVSGGKCYSMPMTQENNYMPCLEEVAKSLQNDGYSLSKVKAIVLNYPSNPLGATCTREYLQKVVDFALKHNILIISDLAYSDIYYDGQEPPASVLEMKGAKDIAIEFHSLSKTYSMTGWRIGWACGAKDAIEILGKLKSTADTGIFKAIQKASSQILTSEEGDKYVAKCNKMYHKKQEIMRNGFRELGWPMDKLNLPKATFYLWLPIPDRYNNSAEFVQDLLETSGVVAVPGSAFGTYGDRSFRMSLVSTDESLEEVIDRMKKDGFYFS